MNPDFNPQTPFQEATSIIIIAALLAAVGCYVAALNNVPLLSGFLLWVALQDYHFVPALSRFPGAQTPMLAAAATVGIVFFLLTIPLAPWLATLFSRAGIASIERQTDRLKKFRDNRKKRARDRDQFTVE